MGVGGVASDEGIVQGILARTVAHSKTAEAGVGRPNPGSRADFAVASVAVPPVAVDPKKVKSFKNAAEFERWLSKHHDRETELWIKIHKKASGLPTITHLQAIDVALCWGWIDGLRKGFDERSFLQRFTPRKPRSIWSQINRENVERLSRAGRMTPHGQRHVDAAKADGRWAAAYARISESSADSIPDDLRRAIAASRKAEQTFRTLNRQNLFAITFRTNIKKTAAGRQRTIASLVAMLERGETISPQSKPLAKQGTAKHGVAKHGVAKHGVPKRSAPKQGAAKQEKAKRTRRKASTTQLAEPRRPRARKA